MATGELFELEVAQADGLANRVTAPGNATEFSFSGGTHAETNPDFLAADVDGELAASFDLESYFERVWVVPSSFDAGFIVEESEVEVLIWNAFRRTAKTLTAISADSGDGTSSDSLSLPLDVGALRDQSHTITVLEDGPASQSTTYSYTVSSEEFDVLVTGTRVEKFPFLPDWANGVEVDLELLTAITASKWTFAEQRLSLMAYPLRVMVCDYLESGDDATGVINYMQGLNDRLVAFPLYVEPMKPASDFSGNSTIELLADPEHYWHLQNLCEYVCLIDTESKEAELKEISGISGTTITLQNACGETLDYTKTVIFPAILGKLESIEFSNLSPTVLGIKATWKEYHYGL